MNSLNEIQELQLNMSKALLAECVKHELKIIAGYGTLLGAIRHKGFIPWDDDMDFVMLREDYDRLISMIKSNGITLPDPFYFDISSATVIKVRCGGTCMLHKNYKLNNVLDQSVWVDIFCLDSIPDNDLEFNNVYQKIVWNLRISNSKRLHNFVGGKKAFLLHLYSLFHSVRKEQNEVERLILKAGRNCKNVANILVYSLYYPYDRIKKYDKHYFQEILWLPFENITIPCPKEYEKILEIEYGDWRTPIEGASLHGELIVDLNKSYKTVVHDLLKEKPWYLRFLYKY